MRFKTLVIPIIAAATATKSSMDEEPILDTMDPSFDSKLVNLLCHSFAGDAIASCGPDDLNCMRGQLSSISKYCNKLHDVGDPNVVSGGISLESVWKLSPNDPEETNEPEELVSRISKRSTASPPGYNNDMAINKADMIKYLTLKQLFDHRDTPTTFSNVAEEHMKPALEHFYDSQEEKIKEGELAKSIFTKRSNGIGRTLTMHLRDPQTGRIVGSHGPYYENAGYPSYDSDRYPSYDNEYTYNASPKQEEYDDRVFSNRYHDIMDNSMYNEPVAYDGPYTYDYPGYFYTYVYNEDGLELIDVETAEREHKLVTRYHDLPTTTKVSLPQTTEAFTEPLTENGAISSVGILNRIRKKLNINAVVTSPNGTAVAKPTSTDLSSNTTYHSPTSAPSYHPPRETISRTSNDAGGLHVPSFSTIWVTITCILTLALV